MVFTVFVAPLTSIIAYGEEK